MDKRYTGVEIHKGSLQGKLLISQPVANSTFFAQSVVLVCEHHANGAWGLVLNKPSIGIMTKNVAQDLDLEYSGNDACYIGGPVHADGLHFVHTPDCVASNTFWVTNNLCVTSSVSILQEIINGRGPTSWRLCLGISSWQAGQLDGEMKGETPWTPQHRWLTTDVPNNIVEKPVKSIWKESTAVAINNSVNNFF